MAFGFPASYKVERELLGDRQTAREAVTYALDALEWPYSAADRDHFRATVPMNMMSWGETIFISITDGRIAIRSVCSLPLQLFDWGKNKQNVEQFLARFSPKELRKTMTPQLDSQYFDKSGMTPVGRLLHDDPGGDG
jgi:hypothetical protein